MTWSLPAGEFTGPSHLLLVYGTDLVSAGYVGLTTSPELGELVYFDWAPNEWQGDHAAPNRARGSTRRGGGKRR